MSILRGNEEPFEIFDSKTNITVLIYPSSPYGHAKGMQTLGEVAIDNNMTTPQVIDALKAGEEFIVKDP